VNTFSHIELGRDTDELAFNIQHASILKCLLSLIALNLNMNFVFKLVIQVTPVSEQLGELPT
jgi:hypothetical protein